MKKSLLILMSLLGLMLLAGCQPTAPVTPMASSIPAIASQVTTSQPIYGGILRFLTNGGPQMMGYALEMSPTDIMAMFPVLERLIDYSNDRDKGPGWEPALAESVDEDIANKRIIFHLRHNVKFHDGSDLNADAVIWNFQRLVENKKLLFLNHWKGIRKLDDLTVQIDYTEYNNQLLKWGFTQIHSRAAWETASGGNLEKGKEWARSYAVGTGPFMVQKYVRDDHTTLVKNPNYWVPGKPYLDGIQITIIPDPVTAKAVMLAGEADYWFGAPVNMQKEMVGIGFNGPVSWFGLPICILPNTADPASKWNDIRLRQAIEYALDKKAITDTFGFGYFTPLTTVAPPGELGYDPDYPARNYDRERSRRLLADAGYTDGISAKLLISFDSVDIGQAPKQYLDAVGFQIDLDVADPGRFYGTIFGPTPGPDLALCWSGTDITGFGSYIGNLSSYAFIRNSYLGHPAAQKILDDESLIIPDTAGQKAMTQRLVKYLADNVMVIPLYWATGAVISPTYVHPLQSSNGGFRWHSEEVWMEKH